MATVIGINGEIVPVDGEAYEPLVEFLEALLADAQTGRVHAIACAYATTINGAHYMLVGTGMGYDLLGAVTMAERRLAANLGDEG